MTNYLEEVSREITQHVIGLFESNDTTCLLYHNLAHTQAVATHAREIADHYPLSPLEKFALHASAWFHDTGHLESTLEGHEEKSALIMRRFLGPKLLPGHVLHTIEGCILATRLPTSPSNLLESIICDADTYHFGTPELKLTDVAIRLELELRMHCTFQHWEENTLHLLEKHQFFTTYCQQLLHSGKEKNILALRTRLANTEFSLKGK